MKNYLLNYKVGMLAMLTLLLANVSGYSQTNYILNNFDSINEVTNNGGYPWINWFGTAYYTNVWDPSDASNNPSSGSMKIVAIFPDAGVGGQYGPQFLVMDNYSGANPPNGLNGFQVTNFECDIRFDPSSQTQISGGTTNFGTVEFGTRGNTYNQYDFGSVTLTSAQTNWVHVSIPINAAANENFTNIPNVYVKMYSGSFTNQTILYVDNVKFVGPANTVTNPPPVLTIQKAVPGLRIFAGSVANTYDREQLTSVDKNQSWVGGSYPVSYSFTLKSFPVITSSNQIFRFHIFLVPTNYAGGSFTGNEYIEYQASNDLWLNVSATTPSNVLAEVAWKTNLPNANPNNEVISNYVSTAVGTWTLTFSSATSGSLTPPGGSPLAFSIPAAAAGQFANPLAAFFGVQPDSGYGEGKFTDVSHIQTIGVASPGVAINDDFTTDSTINTAVWDISNSAQTTSLALVSTNTPYWISWTLPDIGYGLGVATNVTGAGPWMLPEYYNNYNDGNDIPGTATQGALKWILVPSRVLPTVDGQPQSGQALSPNAFFKMFNPPLLN